MVRMPDARPWRLLWVVILLAGLMAWAGYRASLPELIEAQASERSTWTPAILADTSSVFLPDYSYAGYRWGEEERPEPPVTHHATAFGVVPDDGLDDTAALRSALDSMRGQRGWAVLGLPPGRIDISGVLFLEQDSLIIRGSHAADGSAGTALVISGSLTSWADPKADSLLSGIAAYQQENNLNNLFRPFSAYTWAGGVLWSRQAGIAHPIPPMGALPVAGGWDVLSGHQAERQVRISAGAPPPAPGALLEVHWFNRDGEGGSFLKHVLGPYDLPIGKRLTEDPNRPLITQPVTVLSTTAVSDGWLLTLQQPLLHDVRPEWGTKLVASKRTTHIGIEHLSLHFEPADTAPHHLDKGYNGIYLTDTQHSWVYNVHIHDADTAVLTNRTHNITVSRLWTSGREGHHSIYPSNSYGVLVRDFRLDAPALHHPTFSTGSVLSVYTDGHIRAARLDQHGGLNQQNLYDRLTLQAGSAWLDGGGAGYWNPVAGRYNTFWNVEVTSEDAWAGQVRDAPDARLIGITSNLPELRLRYGPNAYVEGLQQPGISVPSLYEWQRERRLRGHDSDHPR